MRVESNVRVHGKDLQGQKIGSWTVGERLTRRTSGGRSMVYWLCECECGKTKEVASSSLRARTSLSCGHGRSDLSTAQATIHGMSRTPEYKTWLRMRERCSGLGEWTNPDYAARGIRVCEDWSESFEAFFEDMGPKPGSRYSIERNDVNGDYTPQNCRWATRFEQANNKRNNRFLTFRGRTLTFAQWARETGLTSATIRNRIERGGWTVERTLTTPVQSRRKSVA